MTITQAIGNILSGIIPDERVTAKEQQRVEELAEEVYATTGLSSHEAIVLVATKRNWDKGDIGWLIGRSTMTVDRIRRDLRQRGRDLNGDSTDLEARLLADV